MYKNMFYNMFFTGELYIFAGKITDIHVPSPQHIITHEECM